MYALRSAADLESGRRRYDGIFRLGPKIELRGTPASRADFRDSADPLVTLLHSFQQAHIVRLSIIPKTQLSQAQHRQATLRIFASEHASDVGPRVFWNRPDHDRRHLVLFDVETEEFVGTVHCAIIPPVVQDFTWWIDSRMRRKGYWRVLADDLASDLKRKHGITTVGLIIFGHQHNVASHKIAERIRSHFDKPATVGQSGGGRRR